jgi:hypothetical protein
VPSALYPFPEEFRGSGHSGYLEWARWRTVGSRQGTLLIGGLGNATHTTTVRQ